VTLLSLLVLAPLALVEKAWASTPCCEITSINVNGRVTAKDLTSKRTFQFKVDDKTVLGSLRVGQQIYADFATNKVSLDGAQICCGIVSPPVAKTLTPSTPAGTGNLGKPNVTETQKPKVHGSEPCCNITGVDAATGLFTARETATGRTFQFKPTDAALLRSLKPGQTVFADFATQKVSVDGGQPCCEIVQASTVQAPRMPVLDGAQVCCAVVANPTMKGRMGKLIVAFPEGAKIGETRIDVYKAAGKESITGGFGNQAVDLLPGSYAVVISGKRVENVPITSGHDTRLRVGVLRMTGGGDTRFDVFDADDKRTLTGGFGAQVMGFPVGTVHVHIAGQSEAVTIKEGTVMDI
jgi:hypothetical protein